jgi:hypothetical protein
MILPRQARDKHREKLQKRPFFLRANGLSGVGPGFITGGGGSVFTATNIEAYQSMEDYHEFADPFFEVR